MVTRKGLSVLSFVLSGLFLASVAFAANDGGRVFVTQVKANVARAETQAVTEATRVEASVRVTVRATIVASANTLAKAERPPEPTAEIQVIPVTILPTPTAEPAQPTIDPTATARVYEAIFQALSSRVETTMPLSSVTPTPVPFQPLAKDEPTIEIILITPLYPTETIQPTLTT